MKQIPETALYHIFVICNSKLSENDRHLFNITHVKSEDLKKNKAV